MCSCMEGSVQPPPDANQPLLSSDHLHHTLERTAETACARGPKVAAACACCVRLLLVPARQGFIAAGSAPAQHGRTNSSGTSHALLRRLGAQQQPTRRHSQQQPTQPLLNSNCCNTYSSLSAHIWVVACVQSCSCWVVTRLAEHMRLSVGTRATSSSCACMSHFCRASTHRNTPQPAAHLAGP
jgi:hypothetical protein